MAYAQLTMSAASIEFVRDLGGTGLHIGIFGALPTGMLFLQFLAAVVANRLRYRRRVWFWLTLLQRLIVLPIAAGPWLLPDVSTTVWMWAFLLVTAANQGLIHFTTPLWLSWMGDYLPHAGLSHYWGVRQLWMQWTAAAAMLLSSWVLIGTDLSIRVALPALVGLGAVLGVIDICLFARIDEPPVTQQREPRMWDLLRGPFRNRQFRSFIRFMSFWHFAAMLGAPFISLYLLEVIGLSIGQVLLLWTFSWAGGAILSRRLGSVAEVYGNRPVLVGCIWLKSINMIGLLLIPANPTIALLILIPVFMADSVLNAGIAIATNGFLLKNSPAANRTMYIAAGTAVAGLIGGITSVVAGGALSLLQSRTADPSTGFQILFAASLAMRCLSTIFVHRVREQVATNVSLPTVTSLLGVTPSRILRFPVGLYQSWAPTRAPSVTQTAAIAPQTEEVDAVLSAS